MDVMELLRAAGDAYTDVEAKATERDEAAKVYHAATDAHTAAADKLASIQASLNAVLGKSTDTARVRIG